MARTSGLGLEADVSSQGATYLNGGDHSRRSSSRAVSLARHGIAFLGGMVFGSGLVGGYVANLYERREFTDLDNGRGVIQSSPALVYRGDGSASYYQVAYDFKPVPSVVLFGYRPGSDLVAMRPLPSNGNSKDILPPKDTNEFMQHVKGGDPWVLYLCSPSFMARLEREPELLRQAGLPLDVDLTEISSDGGVYDSPEYLKIVRRYLGPNTSKNLTIAE